MNLNERMLKMIRKANTLKKVASVDYDNIFLEGVSKLKGEIKHDEYEDDATGFTGSPSKADPYSPEEYVIYWTNYSLLFDVKADLKPIAKANTKEEIKELVSNIEKLIEKMEEENKKFEYIREFTETHENRALGSSEDFKASDVDFVDVNISITDDAILHVKGHVSDNFYDDSEDDDDYFNEDDDFGWKFRKR
jgi:hypothetical protein